MSRMTLLFFIVVLITLSACVAEKSQSGTGSDNSLEEQEDVIVDINESPITGHYSTEPPDLYINYGGQRYKGVKGTYSWNYDKGNGEFVGIEADSPGPGDLVKDQSKEIYVDAGGILLLSFEEEQPDSYSVVVWRDFDDTDYVSVESGNQIILPETSGAVIYEVKANWVQGNAYYAFVVLYSEGE